MSTSAACVAIYTVYELVPVDKNIWLDYHYLNFSL